LCVIFSDFLCLGAFLFVGGVYVNILPYGVMCCVEILQQK
jgi:hypothetical protein